MPLSLLAVLARGRTSTMSRNARHRQRRNSMRIRGMIIKRKDVMAFIVSSLINLSVFNLTSIATEEWAEHQPVRWANPGVCVEDQTVGNTWPVKTAIRRMNGYNPETQLEVTPFIDFMYVNGTPDSELCKDAGYDQVISVVNGDKGEDWLGITHIKSSALTGRISRVVVELNDHYASEPWKVRLSVVMHEVTHGIGLEHTEDSASVLNPSPNRHQFKAGYPLQYDSQRVADHYGVPLTDESGLISIS